MMRLVLADKNMLNFFRKSLKITKFLFTIITVYFVVISTFIIFTNKDASVIDPNIAIDKSRQLIYKNIDELQSNKTKEGKRVLSIYKSSFCFLVGEACTNNPSDGDINFNNSFFGLLSKGIVAPYQSPPASGVYWVYSGLQKTGLIPNTYAAEGIGFAAIKPIANIWKIFRDAALTILVLVVTVIGFLIMFRIKINPQTVISLENSLPRIVVSLILIVFSFAIVGFLIDLMYVTIVLGTSILGRSEIIDKLVSGGTATLLGETLGNWSIIGAGPGSGIGNAILNILPSTLGTAIRFIVIWGAYILTANFIPGGKYLLGGEIVKGEVPFIGGLIGLGISVFGSVVITSIFGSLAGYILSIIILVTTGLLVFFRIFFALLMAYIRIILFTIFAPMILLLNAIPGKNFFAIWIKNLIADLAAFPITAILILVSSNIINATVSETNLWTPPFLSTNADPIDFAIIIGIGILFLIPNIIKKVRESFGIKPSGLGITGGLFFGGASGLSGLTSGALGRAGTFKLGIDAVLGARREKGAPREGGMLDFFKKK